MNKISSNRLKIVASRNLEPIQFFSFSYFPMVRCFLLFRYPGVGGCAKASSGGNTTNKVAATTLGAIEALY
jgi:hypothetical protein